MSIPLDRFYNFVDSLSGGDIIIYRFLPHGSKKIVDLKSLRSLKTYKDSASCMICYDQEPLDYDYYLDPDRVEELNQTQRPNFILTYCDQDSSEKIKSLLIKKNLKMVDNKLNAQSYVFLLHSEKNSMNLTKYEKSGFIGVYWWSHAVIARDWFRYAEHDLDLQHKQIQKDFLIYNRAWSGTREYRLKFAELIVQHDLQDRVAMKFDPRDDGQHYQSHVYRNTQFKIDTPLENYFELNTYDATASADYVATDYVNTGIEVVLETLFDDSRWQLTEKILRPIACGQPFMLATTAGSLEYLRGYGFRTFAPLIDEYYDTIHDPMLRLTAIVKEMHRIRNLNAKHKQYLFDQLREIAKHNRGWFFSSEFQQDIIQELLINLAQARNRLQGS